MIQINPLKSYIDGGVRAALTTPPSASLVFDLPGKAIWVKGVKLKGTDHTYTFSHDNYITLTNTPDSNESEDIKIGVNTSALKSAIDTTYGVVSTTANGLAPKFTSGNKQAAAAATTYYFLGWAGSTLKWYQAPFRNIRINSETTDCLGVNNTDPLIISSGNGISVTWDSTNKKIIITNTKPDINHNTDTKVAQSVTTQNKNYAIILKGNDSDEGSITTVNFSTYLKFNPSTKQLTINGSKVITTIDTFVGATTSADGSVGLVTKPLIANRLQFLRGDGTWATPIDTWRPVKVEGTEKLGSNALDLSAGNGISIIYNSDTKKIIITNTKPDVNHNTHYTTMLYIGENNDTKANKNVANPYLKLFDDNTRRATFQIKAGNGIAVASDANGNITITNSSPDVNHNTDITVKQTPKTDNINRPLMMINGSTSTGEQINTSMFSTGIYANANTKMITANGFIKAGSSNNYVLLGDGGHKTESSLSVANADKVDGYHATSGRTFNGNINWSENWNDAWSDGTNKHPWYGFDHRYPNTGAYSTTISDYFGMTIKTNNILRLDFGTLLLNGTNIYNINVASTTKLQTARTIWGQSFNGTANVDNTLRIKQTTGNYCEGIRIQTGDGAWATIILGATADSGTNTNAWSIHRKNDNNFAISRNSADGVNGLVMTSVGMGLGTTAPISRLTVAGSITPTAANVYNIGTSGNYYNTIYSRVLCGETTSTSIYHQIAIGYPGHDRIDFDEWGGAFYFNKTSSSSRHTIATINLGGLSTTNTITYGFNGLQYFNQITGTTSGATSNANPYNDWFHIIRMNHANNNGYFVDLATAFFQDAMYFRRIVSGQDNGWRKILHDGNSYVTGGKGVINGTTITQVDNADKVDGLHVHGGRNNEANKIVRTDVNGYIQAGWINTTSGDMGTTAINKIYCSNDSYIRYKTPANFFSTLANSGNNISITVAGQNRTLTVGYASNADMLDGYHLSTLVDRSGENLIIGTTHASTIGWKQNGWSGGISTYDENNGVYKMWSTNGWHTLYYILDSQYASKSISFSFDIMFVSSESAEGPVDVYVGSSAGYLGSSNYRPSTSNLWEHKKGTFTLGSTPIFGIMIRGTDNSGKSCFYRIKNLKVELGDLPTIWTPAHADITWNNLTGKPSSFIPSAHTHTVFNNNLMIKGTNGISDSASIHLGIGDSDTGFKWISDGKCQIYANNVAVGEWTSGGMNWFKNPTVNGNKVWNAGNDGSGSGLDADTVDGYHANSLITWKDMVSGRGALTWSEEKSGVTIYSHYTGHGLGSYRAVLACKAPSNSAGLEINAYWCVNPSDSAAANNIYYRVKRDAASDWGPYTKLLQSDGNATITGSYYANSDIRYKLIQSQLLNKVNSIAELPIFTYYWKDNSHDDKLHIGSSAQAVKEIFPELVTYDESKDFYNLDYATLGTIAGITACKELVTQKSELQELKEKVKQLEDKLRKYENIL